MRARQRPQVGPQGAPGRRGDGCATREGEALDHRLAQERLGLRLKAQRLAEGGQLRGGVKQRLGPFPRPGSGPPTTARAKRAASGEAQAGT